MNQSKKIKLSNIRLDGGTQARAALDQDVVDEYAIAIAAGASFPPLVVVFDGASNWLVDGFHRFHAYMKAGHRTVSAFVTKATLRSAVLQAIAANEGHGHRRTNADKRHAVEMLLGDDEWRLWSQEAIAEAAHVSKSLVSKIVSERASLHGGEIRPAVRVVERGGQAYQQDTTKIGRSRTIAAPVEKPHDCQLSTAKKELQQTSAKVFADAAGQDTNEPSDGEEEFDALHELEEANVQLTALRKILESDDKAAEALRWRNAFEVVDRRCNEHLGTIATRDRQIAFLSKQLGRCGKAVGELETDKIGAAVERLVREAQEAP